MSETTDDMVDGLRCSWCGVYFVKAHGYPVLCGSCVQDAEPEDLIVAGLTRATEEEL